MIHCVQVFFLLPVQTMKKSKKYSPRHATFALRMPYELRERVQLTAQNQAKSVNQLICDILEKEFPPINPFDSAVLKYSSLQKMLNTTADEERKKEIARDMDDALMEMSKNMEQTIKEVNDRTDELEKLNRKYKNKYK